MVASHFRPIVPRHTTHTHTVSNDRRGDSLCGLEENVRVSSYNSNPSSSPSIRREAAILALRRLRRPEPRPVHSARGARSRVARGLPQVPGVPAVSRRELHVLRARRQNVLQAGLRAVCGAFFIVHFSECIC